MQAAEERRKRLQALRDQSGDHPSQAPADILPLQDPFANPEPASSSNSFGFYSDPLQSFKSAPTRPRESSHFSRPPPHSQPSRTPAFAGVQGLAQTSFSPAPPGLGLPAPQMGPPGPPGPPHHMPPAPRLGPAPFRPGPSMRPLPPGPSLPAPRAGPPAGFPPAWQTRPAPQPLQGGQFPFPGPAQGQGWRQAEPSDRNVTGDAVGGRGSHRGSHSGRGRGAGGRGGRGYQYRDGQVSIDEYVHPSMWEDPWKDLIGKAVKKRQMQENNRRAEADAQARTSFHQPSGTSLADVLNQAMEKTHEETS